MKKFIALLSCLLFATGPLAAHPHHEGEDFFTTSLLGSFHAETVSGACREAFETYAPIYSPNLESVRSEDVINNGLITNLSFECDVSYFNYGTGQRETETWQGSAYCSLDDTPEMDNTLIGYCMPKLPTYCVGPELPSFDGPSTGSFRCRGGVGSIGSW